MGEKRAGRRWAVMCVAAAVTTLASCGGTVATEPGDGALENPAETVASVAEATTSTSLLTTTTTLPPSTTLPPNTTLPTTTSTTLPDRQGPCGILDDGALIEIFGAPPDEVRDLPGQCVLTFETSGWALILTPRDRPATQVLVDFGPTGEGYAPLESEPRILVSGPFALVDLGATSIDVGIGTPEGRATELSEAETAERDRILEAASRAILELLGE